MESGWVPDNTQAGLQHQSWTPGEPQPSLWTGLKVERKDRVIPVTTFRCPNCGYLESYAIPESQNSVSVSEIEQHPHVSSGARHGSANGQHDWN